MIEFKAECGHTIRAKDEDEGKVVRCSYCGREAQVPADDQSELDYLFSELEASEAEAKGAPPRTVRRGRRPAGTIGTGRADTGFNPFSLVLKMGYSAAIIIVLILVSKSAYQYWTSPGRSGDPDRPLVERTERDSPKQRHGGKRGLLATKLATKKGGIYVSSVPSGALVRVRLKGSGEAVEVFRDPEAQQCTADTALSLDPGRYEVAVAVKINDASLRKYPDYVAFRRKIDAGGGPAVLDAYFLPDGAQEVTTVELPNRPILLLRKYDCEVIGKDWSPLVALFLPDRPLADVIRFLPRKQSYGFEDADVEWELDYYGVRQSDRKYIIDALHRVGMVMYRGRDGSTYRCFAIHMLDGSVTAREYKDPR